MQDKGGYLQKDWDSSLFFLIFIVLVNYSFYFLKRKLLTDKALIEGCVKENKLCQKELFLRYAGKMLTVCRRYARHQLEAEDILQDAFIKVFDKIDQFKFNGSFEGWIRRIVVNTALKNHQKSSFQKEQIGLEDYEENSLEPSVYAQLHEEELLNLIASLPDGYRIVFNLYVMEGFSHKEIAETLKIQEATSRSQLLKARKMLQSKVVNMQKISA